MPRLFCLPRTVLAAVIGLAILFVTGPVYAAGFAMPWSAASGANIVQDIRVEGTERLEPETVISYLTLPKATRRRPRKSTPR